MLVVTILLSLFCMLLLVALFFSVKKNLQCIEKLDEVNDQVEKSLEILNTCYQRAVARTELDVMSDEPIVRELVNDLQICRDSILLVANLIVDPLREDDEENN